MATWVSSRLQQVAAEGDGDGFGAVGGAELLEEEGCVFVNHGDADAERLGDVGVRQPVGQGFEDFPLARRERRHGRVVADDALNFFRNVALPRRDGTDGGREFRRQTRAPLPGALRIVRAPRSSSILSRIP